MIDYDLDGDGIATLSWNVANRPMNVLNAASVEAFDQALEKAIVDTRVRGMVITSARKEFVVGGDLDLIRAIATAKQAMAVAGPVTRVFRKLETCGKPVVAAVNGTALGGGLELCLACHRRIVAEDPKIQLGMPEVTLGLLPGAGGTQRLPRMIGIKAALPFLLEGRKVTPSEALEAGLVDEVVPRDRLIERAKEWVKSEEETVKPWDLRGFKPPGGSPQAPGPMQIFMAAPGEVLNKTAKPPPAIEAILGCVYDGCQVDIETGLKIEQRQFARVAISAATKNMIRTLFYSIGDANRLAARPKGVPSKRFTNIGVLGAGMMGGGLAHVCAQAGLQVILIDKTEEAAENGKRYSEKLLEAQVNKGRLSASQRDSALTLIRPTVDFSDLASCELVIEAVFEDREIKAEATRKAEAEVAPDTIFASNTSTLSITSLASRSMRPDRFIGLHFFSPVERMQLVEVVRGKQSTDAAIACGMDFARAIRKTPILVNDCPAFYANRAFGMYPYEAMIMLAEGIDPRLIENAGRLAGMPMPPLALVDRFSIELLYKAMKQEQTDKGDAYCAQPQDAVLTAMIETFGRPGRKVGKGFYDYQSGAKKHLWLGLAEAFPLAKLQPSVEEIVFRLMYSQSLEAARCVNEGIVTPVDADVGSLLGWGFPAVLGGAISQIDTIGARRFVAECDRLAQRYGPRFNVPDALRAMADANQRYIAA
jgi:3-hydroxyacyl-CoA dehydrogenase / enoyl-CoA hydratase / 3-hydroxybutyryl-CoA epimerase